MDKLSDKIKEELKDISLDGVDYKYMNGRKKVLEKYLPEIEKLEKEKDELIHLLIEVAEYRLFHSESMDVNTDLQNLIITTIEKITEKLWEQITKEQE
jgi:hypothetical protein